MHQPAHLVADLEELKAIYAVLVVHSQGAPELLHLELAEDMRRVLERAARVDGVNPADEASWHGWLGLEEVTAEAAEDARPRRHALN